VTGGNARKPLCLGFSVLNISHHFPSHPTLSRDGRAMEVGIDHPLAGASYGVNDGTVTGVVAAPNSSPRLTPGLLWPAHRLSPMTAVALSRSRGLPCRFRRRHRGGRLRRRRHRTPGCAGTHLPGGARRRRLTHRRNRIGDRLTHRTPMHTMRIGQPADRCTLTTFTTNLLEQLHPRHLPLPPRWASSQKPPRVGINAPGGAKSNERNSPKWGQIR